MNERVIWLWNRLRCMGPSEILHRVKEKAIVTLQRCGFLSASVVPEPTPVTPKGDWLALNVEVDPGPYVRAAEQILAGEFNVFALRPAQLGPIPQWNTDPKSGIAAPRSFGRSLNYRDNTLVGDIKYLWEPNRHLQWVTLAQAYRLTGQDRLLQGLGEQINSWLEQCPYPLGPNWTSSLELGIRLINWSMVWQLIGGENSPLFAHENGRELRARWLDSIYQHCHTINLYWSKHSSANNHLIGEAAGLFIGSITWPYWSQSSTWEQRARSILQVEAETQNTAEGVNREQAISYQQFVLDFLLFAGLAARSTGSDFPESYWQRLKAMIGFIDAMIDFKGNMPMIGDADDGYVSQLSPPGVPFCPYRSLLATGTFLFSEPDFFAKANGIDDKSRWLMGNIKAEELPHCSLTPSQPRQFPEGGYFILGDQFDTEHEVRCTVDVGPLGYLGIAAHGHADALSLCLSLGGREVLIDPGTYAYHTQKVWREYFRGTLAHNTVRIDHQEQSQSGGNFMWLDKAQAQLDSWEMTAGQQRLVGSHDGYQRLDDPVLHRREIIYHPTSRRLEIIDHLICEGQHTIERLWHFAPDCEIAKRQDALQITVDDNTLALEFNPDQNREIILYRGSESPAVGWYSASYDLKQPTTTAIEKLSISGSTTLSAIINV